MLAGVSSSRGKLPSSSSHRTGLVGLTSGSSGHRGRRKALRLVRRQHRCPQLFQRECHLRRSDKRGACHGTGAPVRGAPASAAEAQACGADFLERLRIQYVAQEDTLSSQLNRGQLSRLARLGAATRLAEIRGEQAALEAFLAGAGKNDRRFSTARQVTSHADDRVRRRGMSAAQRKAVSERMKKYWAARRKAKSRSTGV